MGTLAQSNTLHNEALLGQIRSGSFFRLKVLTMNVRSVHNLITMMTPLLLHESIDAIAIQDLVDDETEAELNQIASQFGFLLMEDISSPNNGLTTLVRSELVSNQLNKTSFHAFVVPRSNKTIRSWSDRFHNRQRGFLLTPMTKNGHPFLFVNTQLNSHLSELNIRSRQLNVLLSESHKWTENSAVVIAGDLGFSPSFQLQKALPFQEGTQEVLRQNAQLYQTLLRSGCIDTFSAINPMAYGYTVNPSFHNPLVRLDYILLRNDVRRKLRCAANRSEVVFDDSNDQFFNTRYGVLTELHCADGFDTY